MRETGNVESRRSEVRDALDRQRMICRECTVCGEPDIYPRCDHRDYVDRIYVDIDAVLAVVGDHAVSKYDPADNARRALIRRFIRGEAR